MKAILISLLVACVSSGLKAYDRHSKENKALPIECVDCDKGLQKDGWVTQVN